MIKSLFKNILVVVNSSEASMQAAKYAIVLAKVYHCNVKAIYVVDTATLKYLQLKKFFVQEESSEYEQNLMADGARYLKYVEEIGHAKGVQVQTELRKGAIWSEITICAKDSETDLILLGCVETDGVDKRDVITSSYRKILTTAHCSVLIVKEEMTEKLYKNV